MLPSRKRGQTIKKHPYPWNQPGRWDQRELCRRLWSAAASGSSSPHLRSARSSIGCGGKWWAAGIRAACGDHSSAVVPVKESRVEMKLFFCLDPYASKFHLRKLRRVCQDSSVSGHSSVSDASSVLEPRREGRESDEDRAKQNWRAMNNCPGRSSRFQLANSLNNPILAINSLVLEQNLPFSSMSSEDSGRDVNKFRRNFARNHCQKTTLVLKSCVRLCELWRERTAVPPSHRSSTPTSRYSNSTVELWAFGNWNIYFGTFGQDREQSKAGYMPIWKEPIKKWSF